MNFAKLTSHASFTAALSNQLNLATVLGETSFAVLNPLMKASWSGTTASSIAFIDAAVPDYQTLIAGIAPGTEVHLLDSSQDAVTQITNTLLGRQNISSLHIVSHGEAGGLDFGTGKLNLKDLPEYAAQLQSWSNALTNDADILLYGCDVAQGELGQAFTSILSQLTGADVAASADLTGSAALGGNWTLEYQTGSIEAGLAFSQSVRESYTYILPSFTAASPVAVGSNPYSVAIGDFNGDGKADFATANQGSGTVSVRLGDGLGGFSGTTDVAVGINPYSVVIGDFNGDGKADFAAANYNSSTVSVRLGDGLGGFSGTTNVAVGTNPISVVIGDFNGDGKADFAAANDGSGSVSVRLGDGLGGFSGTTTVAVGTNPQSVAIGDFNGDGKADFAAANYASGSVSVRLGDGLGGFSGTTNVTVGGNPNSVAIGNFNGDGKADIVAVNSSSNTVSVLLNTSPKITVAAGTAPAEIGTTGTFTLTLDQPAPIGGLTVNFTPSGTATRPADYSFSTGSNITTVSANSFVIAAGATTATLNVVPVNDGIVDPNETVILTLAAGNDYFLGSNATAQFTAATNFTIGTNPISVAIGDFNGDGKADIAAANRGSNNVSVLLGTGSGSFGAATNFTVGTNPALVAIGDFNGDGKADIAAANENSNSVSVLLGTGSGSFGAATNFTVGVNPRSVAIGDFNGDGKADIATANRGSNNVSVLLGIGSGSFAAATNFTVGVNPRSVAIGDFNGDGKADIATPNFDSNNVSVLLGNGSGSFGAATNVTVGAGPYSVAIGDFNGDGKADIAAANIVSNNVSVLLGTGSGSFGAATNFTVGVAPFSVAIGDFNGDGKADIVAANRDTNTVSVLLNAAPSATLVIADVPVNAAPAIAVSGTPLTYTENDPATLIDATATVTDADSTDFNTGTLTVSYSANGTVDDRLAIRNQGTSAGQIGVAGNAVSYGGTQIGTFTGGTGTTALAITFNASATATAVTALLQNLTYTNVSEAPSTAVRTVQIVMTDGDGGTSTAVTKTINVTAVDDTQFFVTNTNDSGIGSLRQAILNANADAGAETITFTGSTFTDATPDTITLTSGLTLTGDTTITGTGANQLTVAGTSSFNSFTVNAGVTASFDGLTISSSGIGLYNLGTIASVSNSTFSGNQFGINNEGTITSLDSSLFSTNSNNGLANSGTIARVSNSTFNGNSIGITNNGTGAIALVSNNTFSGNTFGINNSGTITTIVNNTIASSNANGINNSGTTTNLYNNLLVGNGVNTVSGTITNQGNNLSGTFAAFSVDSTLRTNGGTTQTYALLPGSAAINSGTTTNAPTTDQRGISRVGAVDIGAFESRGFTVAITGGNNQSAQVSTAFTNPLVVTVSSAFSELVAGGKVTYVPNGSETGPDASFAGNPATIDSSGNASVTATANGTAGSDTVTAGGSGIATPATFSLTNTLPNALPTSSNTSATFNEDTVYTFTTADFPFTDSDSGDTLQAVQITQLPTAGTGSLTLNGNTVNANDAIALTDLTSGKLKFTPFANAFGTNYTSFQFKVSDGNGFSSTAYTMALNVTAVDDTSFVVTNTSDSGVGSLRQAVLDANADAGTETITFSLPTGAQTISLLTVLPTLSDSVNILNTTGAIGLTIRANTAGAFSLFSVAAGQTVAFDQLTLSNANSGIVNRGTIASLNNSILLGNTTGIANANGGTITSLSNSTISGNNTGVLNSSSTIATLSNSTISNNTTGGVVNLNGTINTLSNSTISGNQDGIVNNFSGGTNATIGTLSSNTISGNSRYGILNQGGTLTTISNNTIAGNTNNGIASTGGTFTNVFNNLLISNGDNSPTDPISVDASKNLRGTFANTGVDSTLRDNGGVTQTYALLPNSVALNNGISAGAPTADQRGISRVGAVDIGAFESRGFTLTVTSGNNQSAVHNTAFNPLIVTVSSAFSEPVNGGTVYFDAPTTGASIANPAPPVVTIASGQVSLSPTANNAIGSYSAVASTVNGINTATFSLTNTNTRPTVTTVSKTGTEDTTVSFSSTDFTSQFSDANSDSLTKIQITTLPTKGILRLGSTTVSLNQEITAAQLSTLTYSPNANSNGADSFGWNGFDGAEYATTGATVNLSITPVNDAPTLIGNATLPTVTQNSTNPSGSTLTTLFGTLFSDVDTGASLSGLAIVGNPANPNTQGQWQYSINGTTWSNVGTVSDGSQALALAASTRVRFLPVTGYNGTPAGLTVRALDNTYSGGFTTGSNVVLVNTTTNGGSTAIAGSTTVLNTSVAPRLPQLVWRNSGTGQNAVWQLNNFTISTSYLIPSLPDAAWQIAASNADFNQDGVTDLLWRNQRTGENAIWEFNSTGYQTSYLITTVADLNWQIAGTADFNGDGTPDIIWRNAASGQNSVWQQRGATLQTSYLLPTVTEAGWQIVSTTGDFNQDGITDLLWRNQRTGANSIWQMNRTGYQTSAFITPVADPNWQIVGTGDFDRDGTGDIVWRNQSSGENAIWQMRGATLQSIYLITRVTDTNWQIAGVADLGGSSTPELLWRNKSAGKTVIWQMNGFSYATTSPLPDLGDPNWSVKPFVPA